MMGPRQVAQGALFYGFSIEDRVPSDHLLRAIDRFVDLGADRQTQAPMPRSGLVLPQDVAVPAICLGRPGNRDPRAAALQKTRSTGCLTQMTAGQPNFNTSA